MCRRDPRYNKLLNWRRHHRHNVRHAGCSGCAWCVPASDPSYKGKEKTRWKKEVKLYV